jgi:hypothetical protein
MPLLEEDVPRIFTEMIANSLGVTVRTVQRMYKTGVTARQADVIAVKVLGELPDIVWGERWRNLGDDDLL